MARQPHAGRKSGASQPGRLRIVAGKWRRRLLPVPDGEGLRPTAARIRETLFNWLAPHIAGARCLDLCAGSGALAFEALSRGAHCATLVETSPRALAALRQSAALLDADAATIRRADAVRFLHGAAAMRYDIVFIDPPYAADLQGKLCRLLADRGWLAEGALVYLEQERNKPLPELPDGWQAVRERTAGNVRYLLLATGGTPAP
ncbi:MAG TPA: 16S rRNA (guanine(966)-N(2))-methyltransferase RsmD [Woeseiaceae bacterium]|nr:16S rRNA (guanine(966)-N(2))-methyltransferase RsmD [Woeseiaceae bacterium]